MDFANHLRRSTSADGAVVTLTVDRPEKKNALTRATLAAIAEAAHELATDERVCAVILAGAPCGTFLAGADIDESLQIRTRGEARAFAELGYAAAAALAALPVPVLVAMAGDAFGGGLELPLAGDVRILQTGARVAFVHARMGLTTSWGTAARLPALVGPSVARSLLFSSKMLSAEEALRVGLVTELADDATAAAEALAQAIARGNRAAIVAQKRLFSLADRGPITAAIDAAERDAFVEAWCADAHWAAVDRFFAGKRDCASARNRRRR